FPFCAREGPRVARRREPGLERKQGEEQRHCGAQRLTSLSVPCASCQYSTGTHNNQTSKVVSWQCTACPCVCHRSDSDSCQVVPLPPDASGLLLGGTDMLPAHEQAEYL